MDPVSELLVSKKKEKTSRWQGIIEEWELSGESQIAFCRRKGIKYSTFMYWRTRRPKAAKQTSAKSFSKARISPGPQAHSTHTIRILCNNGSQIIIPTAIDPSALERLLRFIGISTC